MNTWRDREILDLFGIELPIVQAPMAGSGTPQLAVAVSQAGGLGSLACAQMNVDQAREAVELIRAGTSRPINLNFFCHVTPPADPARSLAWRTRLAGYYVEQGLDPLATPPEAGRAPFDDAFCRLVEEHRPEVVSFHFGLPERGLLDRVKATGAKVISSATTVAEARWLEARGCDAVIAMGSEAGGHRGNFLSDAGVQREMAAQVGTFALVPQIADAVEVPVIAAGGIGDARGLVAAMALGASAVQIGTAYLFTPEARISDVHLRALLAATDDGTMITNVFTGRPAREIVNRLMLDVGPISTATPDFPLAGAAVAPLRRPGSADFLNMWSGQAAPLGRVEPAGELTTRLAAKALETLHAA